MSYVWLAAPCPSDTFDQKVKSSLICMTSYRRDNADLLTEGRVPAFAEVISRLQMVQIKHTFGHVDDFLDVLYA